MLSSLKITVVILLWYIASINVKEVIHTQHQISPLKQTQTIIQEQAVCLPTLSPTPLPTPTEMPVNATDLFWLSKIIYAEAGIENEEAQIAVGNVVLNRSRYMKKSIRDVIFQKNQFDPVSNGSISKKPDKKSITSARKVLIGETVIPKNVMFFYSKRHTPSRSWIRTRKEHKTIDNTTFCY